MSLSIFVQTGLIKQEESWFSFNCVIETFKKEKRKEKERKKNERKTPIRKFFGIDVVM